jgi:Fur family peroxide stress response transcriptional regulator
MTGFLLQFRIIPNKVHIPMDAHLTKLQRDNLQEALSKAGQKLTTQREIVYSVLLTKRDHPSVDEVYQRARESMPGLSLATVYNCLETFVSCGLVRQVNHERESTRYCPNLLPHAHFRDEATGRVHDIELPPEILHSLKSLLPSGFQTDSIEISFHGRSQNKPSSN